MSFGLTPEGFEPKRQQDIISEIRASLQASIGNNINLADQSIFGQLVGIFSEREALVWELMEAIYASQYPEGAEGTSVDNILALSGLERLGAEPSTATLLLYGTPGTLIPAGSLVSVEDSPTDQFATDIDATIEAAADAVQVVLFSNVPGTGAFSLSIVDYLGNTLTTSSLAYSATAADVQAAIRALTDTVPAPDVLPYTDVVVTGNFTVGFTITFGSASPTPGEPSSGEQAQNLFTVAANTLQNGIVVTNISISTTTEGHPDQVEVTATATVTGPLFAAAESINTIDTAVSGWTSVSNPADAILGRDIETDTEALQRRLRLLSAPANGPLQAIVADVLLVDDVTSAAGFENVSIEQDNSLQLLTFSATPTSGQWRLRAGGAGGPVTANIAFNATAQDVEDAIVALGSPYDEASVFGNFADGFSVYFGTALTDQSLVTVFSNSLLATATPVDIDIAGGRPAKSFEIIVEGGDDTEIAQAIFDSKPAGIQTYGNTSEVIVDQYGKSHTIYFSRPTVVPIYISINLSVNSLFPVDGVPTIQEELVTLGDQVEIGGLVVVFGSSGLVGAFNDVPGIVDYDLTAGITASPVGTSNIQMQPNQKPDFDTFRIVVTKTVV